jgi:hypothetical protein
VNSEGSQTNIPNTSNHLSNLLRKGKFYSILEDSKNLILEDKTKRGLEIKERIKNVENDVFFEKGMIYDMDGIGHKVNIRIFYPKEEFTIEEVEREAKSLEKRYMDIREMTCPDDDL